MTHPRQPAGSVSDQGNYAGSVSRFLGYAVDLGASTAVFTLALAGVAFVIQVVTSHRVTWTRSDTLVAVLFVVWQFFYFGYSWAVASRSFGMYVLGLRVVRADGTEISPRQGVVRALVFPLSFLLLGLGFLGILLQHERRALHDLIAGTAVVYAWDARAARLRFLAREAEIGARGPARPASGPEAPAQPAEVPGESAEVSAPPAEAPAQRTEVPGESAEGPAQPPEVHTEAPGGAALDGRSQPAGDIQRPTP
jgi:uncharacterized RDD family membrane protein YckC